MAYLIRLLYQLKRLSPSIHLHLVLKFANAEIFASTTLLVVLGTSFLTSLAGLSLALGAFLAGLLIAETEYALQVRSHPYICHFAFTKRVKVLDMSLGRVCG